MRVHNINPLRVISLIDEMSVHAKVIERCDTLVHTKIDFSRIIDSVLVAAVAFTAKAKAISIVVDTDIQCVKCEMVKLLLNARTRVKADMYTKYIPDERNGWMDGRHKKNYSIFNK